VPLKAAKDRAPKGPRGSSTERDSRRWWEAPKGAAARRLMAWAKDIETTAWPRRFANLTYFRYMTGRPVNPAFNYSMVARPASVTSIYGRALWRPPVFNAMAQCDDVLANRVYKSRPFLQVCPIAGDFGARVKAKGLTRWMDGAFYELNLWDIIEMCGQDSRTYGTGYVLVDVGLDDKPTVTRICDDEILLDETEVSVSDSPKNFGVRVFLNRDELLARYGSNPEAAEAIRAAPSAHMGFYFGNDLDVSDVICLVMAWHLGSKDVAGRKLVVVGDFALEDSKYKADHFPVAKLPYKKMSAGWRGQGMAEQVLSLQRELERWWAACSENVQRMAWPRVGIESASNVNEAALAAKSGGTFKYTKTLPQFINPEAITKDQFAYGETIVRSIRERVGISDQAAAGVKPPGLNSGLAIEKQSQIDDGRHVELSLHLEDFVRDIGVLLVEAAEKCKPSFTLPGRRTQIVKWSDVEMAKSSYWLRPFPMSSLPQSIAGRQQIIDTWAAQGRVSKATQNRLEQIPDIDGYLDLVNASADAIEASLDRIVEKGKYEPPTPFADLSDQLATAQSRYLFEKNQGDTPQDRLDLILQYIGATQELIEDNAPPPAPAAPPGFGMPAGPAGPPPVAQPFPAVPNVPAPQSLPTA
jgi:hypothetical protein